MKRVNLRDSGSIGGRMISAPQSPRIPKSLRVPDGISQQQYDSLANFVTGMGTSKDKNTSTMFSITNLDRSQLEIAYRGDWISKKAVLIPAKDSTREWRNWLSDDKDIEAIEDLENELQIQNKVYQAMWKARLYGGAGLLLGTNDSSGLENELNLETVGKDGLKFVHVVSKWDMSAGPIDWAVDSKFYGLPSYYTRANGVGTEVGGRVHPSRVIRFIGDEIPDLNQAQGWGDSILQGVMDAVLAAGSVSQAGATLIQELKMDIIKIPDLSASMSNKEYESRLLARFGAANIAKSLYNILLLDKEEEWARIEANLTGLPDTLKMYLLIASGAVDIPATRFLSQSPAGLSATGESDIRNYYDKCKSEQNTVIAPALQVLDELIVRSALGTFKPGDVVYTWRPLWQMTDKEKSEIAKAKADVYNIDLTAAQLPPNVIRDARINQLIEDGTYPGLEQILDDYGPLEDLDEVEEDAGLGVGLIGPDGKPLEPDPNFDPAQQAAANENVAARKKAVGDMAKRIRDGFNATGKTRKRKSIKTKPAATKESALAIGDRRVDTLYVRRDVTNAAAIIKHFRDQGVPDLQDKTELHVTIMYSRKPVDWTKIGEDWQQKPDGTLSIVPGGMRAMELYGHNSLVLLFNSNALSSRHGSIKYTCEAEWDYDDYTPHITVAELSDPTYDWTTIKPYQGAIEFGREVFEPTKTEGAYK